MNVKGRNYQLTDDFGNNLLSDGRVVSLMDTITQQLVEKISKKRDRIITERLKEIVGIDLNIEEESKRRFKRFAVEYRENEEIIYYNDGSVNGVRIVTFVRSNDPIEYDSLSTIMTMKESYY